MQDFVLIKMRKSRNRGAILCHSDARSRPCGVRFMVGAISRCTGRKRMGPKQLPEIMSCLFYRLALFRTFKEGIFGRAIFVADPRHSPVDVRSFSSPEFT